MLPGKKNLRSKTKNSPAAAIRINHTDLLTFCSDITAVSVRNLIFVTLEVVINLCVGKNYFLFKHAIKSGFITVVNFHFQPEISISTVLPATYQGKNYGLAMRCADIARFCKSCDFEFQKNKLMQK